MSKRKVTFEDGDGEFGLEDEIPKKKVCSSVVLVFENATRYRLDFILF